MNIIGCLALAFGIPYAGAFLHLIYGEKWHIPTTILALQAYCLYEWVMGVNGITEAFVQGSIEADELKIYRIAIFLSTLIYILACYALLDFGAAGVIFACVISMVVRIAVSCVYMSRKLFKGNTQHFGEFVRQTLPSTTFVCGLLISFGVGIYVTEVALQGRHFMQLVVGGVNAAALVMLIAKQSTRQMINLFRKKSSSLEE